MESEEYSKHQESIHAQLVKSKPCLLGIVYSYPEKKLHLKHVFLMSYEEQYLNFFLIWYQAIQAFYCRLALIIP